MPPSGRYVTLPRHILKLPDGGRPPHRPLQKRKATRQAATRYFIPQGISAFRIKALRDDDQKQKGESHISGDNPPPDSYAIPPRASEKYGFEKQPAKRGGFFAYSLVPALPARRGSPKAVRWPPSPASTACTPPKKWCGYALGETLKPFSRATLQHLVFHRILHMEGADVEVHAGGLHRLFKRHLPVQQIQEGPAPPPWGCGKNRDCQRPSAISLPRKRRWGRSPPWGACPHPGNFHDRGGDPSNSCGCSKRRLCPRVQCLIPTPCPKSAYGRPRCPRGSTTVKWVVEPGSAS